MSLRSGIAIGAAAGAAGTTALNAVTYVDMTLRARPASDTPQHTVEKLAEKVRVPIPGRDDARANRIAGLGPLTGVATGVGVGALFGLARSLGCRPRLTVSILAATAGALVASNGPMTVLGITDPRKWALHDWVSDVVPHLAFGAVTAATLRALDSRG